MDQNTVELYNEQIDHSINEIVAKMEININRFNQIESTNQAFVLTQLERLVDKIKKGLHSYTYFICTGEFSSGKSTFLNTLLQSEVLPTASRPCTSVVTEIRLVSGRNGHTSTIFFVDGTTREMDINEFKRIIDGSTGLIGKLASIHHIELNYDIEIGYDEVDFSLLKKLQAANIILVDTPGFGSPYPFKEDSVFDYLQKASFGFWFFSADRIGGQTCKNIIQKIRSKGRRIQVLPVITKSDLIKDKDRMMIEDKFFEEYGDIFGQQVPQFVSSFRLIEAIEKRKIALSKRDEERIKEIDEAVELEFKSGVEAIAMKLTEKTSSKGFQKIKVEEVIKETQEFIQISKELTIKLEKDLKNKLTKMGWTENDKYKKINDIKKRLERWAIEESKRLSENYEQSLTEKVANLLQLQKGAIAIENEIKKILLELNDAFYKDQLEKASTYIIKQFGLDLESSVKQLDNIGDVKFISINEIVMAKIETVFGSISSVGFDVVLKGAGGSVLISLALSASSWPLVGSLLGPVIGIAGGGLLGLALLSLIPAYIRENRHHKERIEQKLRNEINRWISQTKFKKLIQNSLLDAIELTCKVAVENIDNATSDLVNEYNNVKEIFINLTCLQEETQNGLLQHIAKS